MIRVEEDRVFEVDVDVMEACIKLERDKFLRQRASQRVAVKRLCKRDLVCVEGVHNGWVAVAFFLILWLLRIQSKSANSLEVCSPSRSGKGGMAVPPSPQELETTLKSHDHLTAVSHQQLIHSKSANYVVGYLSRSDQGGVVSEAIRPSPGEVTVKSRDHLMVISRQQVIMSGDVETNPGPLDQEVKRLLSTVDDTTFETDDWNVAVMECSSLAAKWKKFSACLGLSKSDIDSIKGDNLKDNSGCLDDAMDLWIKQNYDTTRFGLPSWRTLLTAVAQVNKHLCKQLAIKHQAVGGVKESPQDKKEKPENGAKLRKRTHQDDNDAQEGVPEAKRPKQEVGSDAGLAVTGEACEAIGKCDVVPGKPCLTFPILDREKLSKEEKEKLEQELYDDSIKIMFKFQKLFSATITSMKERKVTVNELSNHLGCLGALKPTYKDSKRGYLRQELPGSETIDDVMAVVRDYSSFFNFHILENIINHVGGEQDKKKLAKYLEDFDEYAKRKVFQCPCEVGTMMQEGHANMFVTLDESYDNCTVSSLNDFREELKRILNIASDVIIPLCRIELGSVKLIFQIPHSMQQAVFPLSDEQEMALAQLGIVQLSCGDYLFTNPEMENTKRAASSGEEDSDSEGHDVDTASGFDDVSMMIDVNVKDKGKNDGSSVADSALGTFTRGSIVTGATFTRRSQFSEDILEKDLKDEPYLRMERELRPPDDSSGLELHQASRRGDLDEVKRLIEEEKLNPLQKDSNGVNALHHAAVDGHLPVAKYLIEEQSLNPACLGWRGWTPLHFAAYYNNLELVNYLVAEQQVDPQCQNEDGYTPLHRASQGGDVNVVRYLVNEMSKHTTLNDVVYDRTNDGNTPLHVAALFGHLPLVKLFITEFNVDPNTLGFMGRPPLHGAAQSGHLDVVTYLVEELKCDPSYCLGEEKATPLHMASQDGHLDVVKYLTVDKHCNPLNRNSYNQTPLHHAAGCGHFKVVEFFISQLNCDPNTPGQWGRTPGAAQEGYFNIIKYLIEEKNCNPSCLDERKSTPLHVACAKGHLNIVKYLTKEQHCNPLCYDKLFGIPLHWAARFGQLQVVKYFIEDLKCPQNIRGVRNTTPLEEARSQGHTNVVQYLMSVV